MPADPTLIVFDLGGVLVRTAHDWPAAIAIAGLPPQLCAGENWATFEKLTCLYDTGQLNTTQFCSMTCEILGLSDTAQVLAALDAWLIDLYPGTTDLLIDLRAAGCRTACLSNTCERHWARLTDPRDIFSPLLKLDHLLSSPDLGLLKPDPRIYHQAQAITGASPADILFFDDKPANVDAAQKVGWRAEQIHPTDPIAQIRHFLDTILE